MARSTDFARGLSLLVIASVVATAPLARADALVAPSVRLTWVRGENAEGCSDGPTIARSISARLGKNVFSESASTSIEGVVEHHGQAWQAHLYMRGADGRLAGVRHLSNEGPDCSALDAAATLAIALAIDPKAALSAAEAPPIAPPTAVDASQPAAHAGPRSDGAEFSARGLLGAGLLPQTSAGVALSAEIAVARSVDATAGALYLPEARTSVGDFAFGLTAGWGGACVRTARARASVSLCGKVLVGAIHSVVFTLEPAAPGDRWWAAGALSAQARLRIAGPVLAELGLEGIAPMTRDRFVVGGRVDPVFRQGPVAGMAFVGLGVTIP